MLHSRRRHILDQVRKKLKFGRILTIQGDCMTVDRENTRHEARDEISNPAQMG